MAEALSKTVGIKYLHEPDCIAVPYAGRARAGLGEYPVVSPGEHAPAQYEKLWDVAFGSRGKWPPNELARRLYSRIPDSEALAIPDPHRSPPSLRFRVATRLSRPNCTRGQGRRLVKSVNATFALEWLLDRYEPQAVLVRRHPLDMLASWSEIWLTDGLQDTEAVAYIDDRGVGPRITRWNVSRLPADASSFAQLTWIAGLTASAYQEVAAAHPEIRVVDHETLCADPIPKFRRLVSDLGLQWSPECEEYLHASNSPGIGYETKRISAQQPGKWRTRFSEEHVRVAREILGPFPIARLYPELQA